MDAALKDIHVADPTTADIDMADITPRAVQKQEKKHKDKKAKREKQKDKEHQKDKKRRHSEVNGDSEDVKRKKKSKARE